MSFYVDVLQEKPLSAVDDIHGHLVSRYLVKGTVVGVRESTLM